MARYVFGTLVLFICYSLSAHADQTIYGPEVIHGSPRGVAVHQSFAANPKYAPFTLTVINGDQSDIHFEDCRPKPLWGRLKCEISDLKAAYREKHQRALDVEIHINGRLVLDEQSFDRDQGLMTKTVQLQAQNAIDIEVVGSTSSFVSVAVTETAPSQPPSAVFTVSPPSGVAPQTVSFNAMGSSASNGSIENYNWTFGDGGTATGMVVSHTYQTPGTFTATLTVVDNRGLKGSSSQKISIIQDVPPVVAFTYQTTPGNLTVTFVGSATPGPGVTISNLSWNFGDQTTGSGATTSHTYQQAGSYAVTLTGTDNKGISSSATHVVIVAAPPTVSLKVASASQGIAPFRALFDTTGTLDPQGLPLSYLWNFGDGATATASGLVPHEFLTSGQFTVTLTVSNSAGLSAQAEVSVSVTNPVLPPSPVGMAPALTTAGVASVSQATQFLYTGANPIQTGVAANAIDQNRVCVLRGRVLDQSGNPLSGAQISVVGAPQLGQTLSRDDGTFDLAANGGGVVTVSYVRSGYFSSQRAIATTFQNYFNLPDVILMRPDPQVTKVSLGSSLAQIARGSTQTDSSGTRTATVLIPSQTTAQLVMPSGQTMTVQQLSIRATEYTVGPHGPNQMPAALPSTSSYTYAAEFSADEALALGAQHVQFSQPVCVYVDNFLNFLPGTVVPVGVYNSTTGSWDPQPNGRVIKILSVTNGVASLDVTGSGQPAASSDLSLLNITSEELAQLGTLYTAGQSLWRAQTDHFSGVDMNWVAARQDAVGPSAGSPVANNDPAQDQDPNANLCGSIIDPVTQVLGEAIAVVGVPFTLNYSTSRAAGRAAERTLWIPMTNATPTSSLQNINVQISVAGQTFSQSFTPSPNLIMPYTWDGTDAYGRVLTSAQIATVQLQYNFSGDYFTTQDYLTYSTPAFSQFNPNFGDSMISARSPNVFQSTFQVPLGTQSAQNEVAGWLISVHHFYDPITQVLYFGNGTKQRAQQSLNRVITIGGTGTAGFSGDGGPAIQAQVNAPAAPFVASDGSIYFTDIGNNRIRKIAPDATISTFAGTGVPGFSGDGGQALQAQINGGGDITMAEGSDQSIYLGDVNNHRIRKITPDGIISTFAGTGVPGFSGDGGQALQAQISLPETLVFVGETLYFTDAGSHTLRAIAPNGIISTIAGTGVAGFSGDGGPATQAQLNIPVGLAVSSAGEFYIGEVGNNRIRKINPTGIISTYAGTGSSGFSGDGGPATQAQFKSPAAIALRSDGGLYVADGANYRIRLISPDGTITTFAGTGFPTSPVHFLGDQGAAIQASFSAIRGLVLTQDGSLILADSSNNRIRKISPVFPSLLSGVYSIPSSDEKEIYIFSPTGQHLQTLDALTGGVKWQFSYDSQGRLLTLVDGDGNTTQITRDANGNPISIVSPYGQTTTLATDSSGNLISVQSPGGATYNMQYASGGILSQFQKPNGAASTFTYDSLGQLTKDQDAVGWFTQLGREVNSLGALVSTNTALERQSNINYQKNIYGQELIQHIDGAGLLTSTSTYNTQLVYSTPDLDTQYTTLQSNGRLGLPAMYPAFVQLAVGANGPRETMTEIRSSQASQTQDPFAGQITHTYTVNGTVSTYFYDGAVHQQTYTSAAGRVSNDLIDLQSRILQTQIGNLTPINYVYDSHGRLAQASQGSRATLMTYDASGNLANVTNSLNQTTSYAYDADSHLTAVLLPDGRQILYTHDVNGNITSITPPGRPQHSFVYDLVDLLGVYTPPTVGAVAATQYGYNLDRQLTQVTRPDGQVIQYTYDITTPHLLAISSPGGTYSYTYNGAGQLGTLSSPDGIKMSYGYIGHLLASVQSSGALASTMIYQYNNNLEVSSSTASGSTLNYGYDPDQLLTSLGPLTIQRDQNALVSGTSLGSLQENLSYNSMAELLTDQLSNLFALGINRDNLGRVASLSETINGVTNTFAYSYDGSGRLTGVNKNNSIFNTYTYDANSNRIGATINGINLSGTVDAQDRLLSYGANTYTYTNNGELASKSNALGTTSYTEDVFGNLKSVVLPSGAQISYLVDGQNRRVGKKLNGTLVNQFVYESQTGVAALLDGSGNLLARFGYATKGNVPDFMITSSGTYRLLSNEVGSVRLVVNASSGQVAEQIDYDEFGQVLADTNPGFQPFGFAGGLYDQDTKLVHFGAREYDSETGRFISKDPLLFGGGDTNLYGYVANDPINGFDPQGLFAIQIGGSIAGLFPAFGGSAESGIAISYSPSAGLQIAGYQSGQVRAGAGIYGGGSLNVTYTNAAQCTSDLNGPSVGGGFDTPFGGGSAQVSQINGKPAWSFTGGVGPGVIGDVYGGVTYTHVGAPLTFFGGH